MMKRTLEDKYNYNNKREKNEFSSGYCLGVTLYQNFIKSSPESREGVKAFIDSTMKYARKGDVSCKGIIAGYRDAANDRKSRRTPPS